MCAKRVAKVFKRDGRLVNFNPRKITDAIYKALTSVGHDSRELAARLGNKVVRKIDQRFSQKIIPSVENIQDIVEEVLVENKFANAAKAYILYRNRRAEIREVKKFLGVSDDLKLSINATKVLKKRYLLKDQKGEITETPLQMFHRVAQAVAKADLAYSKKQNLERIEQDFFEAMAHLEFLPNSPTLMNAGTKIGQLSACFVLPVEDSIKDIFNALGYMALIHQSGGGTGFSFSHLRPKGDVVKTTKGIASGPVSFMRVFDMATEIIKQGGRRRGANMGVLSVYHPDILEFITCKEKEGHLTNFNLSVAVDDKFMQKVKVGGKYELVNPRTGEVVDRILARGVFDLIVATAWSTGDPGLIFIDRINEANPTPAVGKIESTNPCVAGDALVSTGQGLMRMKTIVEQYYSKGSLEVITDRRVIAESCREGSSNAALGLLVQGVDVRPISHVFNSGIKKTVKVVTESGYELEVTPDHKIMTTQGWVAAGSLKRNYHKVLLQSGPGGFNRNKQLPFKVITTFAGKNGYSYKYNFPSQWSYELGLVLGWLIGDGWLRTGDKGCRVSFVFREDDLEVLEVLKTIINRWYGKNIQEIRRSNGAYHLSYHSKLFVAFFESLGVRHVSAWEERVPESIFTAPKEAQVGFLRSLFTADGTVNYQSDHSSYVRLTAKSKQLLKDVQLMLLNFGIRSRIYNRGRKPRESLNYLTVSGRKKTYTSDGISYELEISRKAVLIFLEQIGFIGSKHSWKLEKLCEKKYYSVFFEDRVEAVVPNGRKEVFDLTEPVTHSFIANGFVVSNCGEQPLLPYESCNLGSINLARMVDNGEINWSKLKKTVRLAVHFLDNVIDVNKYPLTQIASITNANRKIGLGVMGFAEMLIKLGIPYDSKRALKLAEDIAKFITAYGREKSIELAEERGSFPNFSKSIWKRKGVKALRNATVTTIAPTGTISIIANVTSGIEPLFAISFVRNVMEGARLLEVSPLFEEIAKRKKFYTRELALEIAQRGSIEGMEKIPMTLRRLFATALDIKAEWHVRMQAAFQKHIDNAVAKTVNLPTHATLDDVRRAYLSAYRLGCKGITVYRYGSRKKQALYLGSMLSRADAEDRHISAESEYSGGCPAIYCPY